jgi:hypothetical protein
MPPRFRLGPGSGCERRKRTARRQSKWATWPGKMATGGHVTCVRKCLSFRYLLRRKSKAATWPHIGGGGRRSELSLTEPRPETEQKSADMRPGSARKVHGKCAVGARTRPRCASHRQTPVPQLSESASGPTARAENRFTKAVISTSRCAVRASVNRHHAIPFFVHLRLRWRAASEARLVKPCRTRGASKRATCVRPTICR